MRSLIPYVLFIAFLSACSGGQTDHDKASTETDKDTVSLVKAPSFEADSAYAYVERQLAFGPRVPGTKGHTDCYNYILNKVSGYADSVYTQNIRVMTYDKTNIPVKNIIAEFNPGATNRVILCAHWDTRPFADQDTKDMDKPILGANDGASGVGILLEIASKIKQIQRKDLGVDLIFFDAEDWGDATGNFPNSYCLGSQYWAKNVHKPDYKADFGILLDMVGAPGAKFGFERYSIDNAQKYLSMVWSVAQQSGYNNYFMNFERSGITDDHVYMHLGTGIPVLDIIDCDPSTLSGFGKYWHTHNDNINAIDRNTLKAVGQTLLNVLSQYQP